MTRTLPAPDLLVDARARIGEGPVWDDRSGLLVWVDIEGHAVNATLAVVLNGKTVIFPWELTMSSFSKEIVEATARRTAEEFIKMGGEKAFRRPVQIQVITDPGQTLKVNYDGIEDEVVVAVPDAGTVPAPAPAPPK